MSPGACFSKAQAFRARSTCTAPVPLFRGPGEVSWRSQPGPGPAGETAPLSLWSSVLVPRAVALASEPQAGVQCWVLVSLRGEPSPGVGQRRARRNSSYEALATRADGGRGRTLSEIPAGLPNTGPAFTRAVRLMEKRKTLHHLTLACPLNHRRILCTEILNQLKMFKKKKKKTHSSDFLH